MRLWNVKFSRTAKDCYYFVVDVINNKLTLKARASIHRAITTINKPCVAVLRTNC